MGITRVATWKNEKQGKAILLEVDKKTMELEHADLTTFNTAAKVKSELERQAGKALGKVYVHVNRDGSLAVATGAEPDVWPEDDLEIER